MRAKVLLRYIALKTKLFDMKKIWISLFLFLPFYSFSQTGTVKVTVTGILSEKGGELSAGIFPEATFPEVGQQLIGKELIINSDKMIVVFEGVPVGTYALAIFQDIDKNKDLATNIVGYPREPIGFSNNVRIRFGPPAFEDAAVTVNTNQTLSLDIQLR